MVGGVTLAREDDVYAVDLVPAVAGGGRAMRVEDHRHVSAAHLRVGGEALDEPVARSLEREAHLLLELWPRVRDVVPVDDQAIHRLMQSEVLLAEVDEIRVDAEHRRERRG